MAEPDGQRLDEADVDRDPLVEFGRWFEAAAAAGPLPEAVALATATPDGRPSLRMVLVKSFDARGFEFCTNYESRKGHELQANPHAALLFYWPSLGRQVRIEGTVERLPPAESDSHFDARPVGSRLSAAASPQSHVVGSREELEARVDALRPGPPRRPASWGCFRLVADDFEFWQHRENRLHDRLRYRRDGSAWLIERLAP